MPAPERGQQARGSGLFCCCQRKHTAATEKAESEPRRGGGDNSFAERAQICYQVAQEGNWIMSHPGWPGPGIGPPPDGCATLPLSGVAGKQIRGGDPQIGPGRRAGLRGGFTPGGEAMLQAGAVLGGDAEVVTGRKELPVQPPPHGGVDATSRQFCKDTRISHLQ